MVAGLPDDVDASSVVKRWQVCDQPRRQPSSFSHRSFYAADICDKRRPSGPAVADIAPRLQNAPSGLRNASSDLWNSSPGLRVRAAAGPGFALQPLRFDGEINRSFQFNHVQPSTAPRHSLYVRGPAGIPDKLRPMWPADSSPSVALSTQCAFPTNDPRFPCLHPQCQACRSLPYQSLVRKPAASSDRKSVMLPLAMTQVSPHRPSASIRMPRPMTASNSDMCRPITYCDSYALRPATVGYSHAATFGSMDGRFPVNDRVIAERLPYQPSTRNDQYRWHPSPGSDHYSNEEVRYCRRQDAATPQWSPCGDRTVSSSPYTGPKLSQMVEIDHYGDPTIERGGEQKAAVYGTVATGDDASDKYQSVRTETRCFIPSYIPPHGGHIPHSSLPVHGLSSARPVSPGNFQPLPLSSTSLLQPVGLTESVPAGGIGQRDEPWSDIQVYSLTNRLSASSVDRSLNHCSVDGERTLPVRAEDGEIDILAKATEGLFSPDDGEQFMAEDEAENCLLFERNQLQESPIKHGSGVVADQWQAYATENTLTNEQSNWSGSHEPAIANGSYVDEHVGREFSDVEQDGGTGFVLHLSEDGCDSNDDISSSESAGVTDTGADTEPGDSVGEVSEAVSGSGVTGITANVAGCTMEQDGRHDNADCQRLADSGTVDDNVNDVSNELSETESRNQSNIAVDDSSYKITFAESDLYEMVDRIEKMDSTCGQIQLGKRSVCSLGMISSVKKRQKLSSTGSEHEPSVVYHVPEANGSPDQVSNENGQLDSGWEDTCTTGGGTTSDSNSALLRNCSRSDVRNAADGFSLTSFSAGQESTCTECQIETVEEIVTNGDGIINTDGVVTPIQPPCTVTTTTEALCSMTTSDTSLTPSQPQCCVTTTTHPLNTVTTTTESANSVTTTTEALCSVTASDTSLAPSQTECSVTTTTHLLNTVTTTTESMYSVALSDSCVTTTQAVCSVTTTTEALSSVTASDSSLTPSETKCSVTTATHPLNAETTTTESMYSVTLSDSSVTHTQATCSVTTTTEALSSVTASDTSLTPSEPKYTATTTTDPLQQCSGTTTTSPLCPLTTTTLPLCTVMLSDIFIKPTQSVCTVSTKYQPCCVTTTTHLPCPGTTTTPPPCLVTTTAAPSCSVTTTTHLQCPWTTTTYPTCLVTTNTQPLCPETTTTPPPCLVSTTTAPSCSVTTTTQALCTLTTTNTFSMPAGPIHSIPGTRVEHSKTDSSLQCSSVKYLANPEESQQENVGLRNCFDFLVGLTSGCRRKYSPTQTEDYHSAVN